MGLLDNLKRRQSGFLNGVDGTMTVRFVTDRPMPKDPAARREAERKAKFDKELPLFMRVSVVRDGAKVADESSLRFGRASDWVISNDGCKLSAQVDVAQIWGGFDAAIFLESVVRAGFSESDLPSCEPGQDCDFSALNGQRFRFVQVPRTDDYAKEHKRKAKNRAGVEKEYDLTSLAVSVYYGAQSTTKSGRGKTNGAAHDDEDLAAISTETLLDVLGDAKDHSIKFSELKLAVTKRLVKSPYKDRRVEIYTWLEDEKNLLNIDSVSYDQSSAGREITLA